MAARPNILLITSDQQHLLTLGCLNPEIQTPNLDRLAAQGTLFTRAYCANPTCTPTRASMITGKYPSQHGGWSLGTKLPETEPTVGDIFQRAGYRTSLVGKAHFQPTRSTDEFTSLEAMPILQDLDFWKTFHGPFYGFDHVELARNHADECLVGQHYALWMEQNGCTNWRDYFQPPTGNNPSQKHTWEIPEQFHYDTWIAERTNALLDQYHGRGENFFLWASFFDPHPAYLVPRPWDTMYDPTKLTVPHITEGEHSNNPPHFLLTQKERPDFSAWQEPGGHSVHGFASHLHNHDRMAKNIAVYYGMVSLMDKYVGKILDRLDELGLRENTLVVFTTDHGHFYGQHGLTAKGPFHYDDLVKIPFIVAMPGRVPAGHQSDAFQSLVDLPQTFLSVCGIDAPPEMTGVDQNCVWSGSRESARDHVIIEHHQQPTTVHLKTYVDDRCKLTVYWNRDYGELFNLREDPGETRNLWNDPASSELKAEFMQKMLIAEIAKEEPLTPETMVLPQKSMDMYVKTLADGQHEITVDPVRGVFELFDLRQDPDRKNNLWDQTQAKAIRADRTRALLFARMEGEPLWMPRTSCA